MRFISVITVIVLFVLSACNSQDQGYETTDSGLKYKFYVENNAPKPAIGDIVTLQMTYGKEDSVLFSTDVTKEHNARFPLRESQFQGDIFEGIGMMSIGDSARFVISADSFFLITANSRRLPPFVDPGEMLYFDMKLVDFQSEEAFMQEERKRLAGLEVEEQEMLKEYVVENDLEDKMTEAGIYFIPERKGKGRKLREGDMAELHYSIKIMGGRELFSSFTRNRPVNVEIGSKFDTEGFMAGVEMMRVGDKAKLVVPSEKAWGAKGRAQTIPPFSTLIYEVEILDAVDKETYQKEMEAQKKEREKKQANENRIRMEEEPEKIEHYVSEKFIGIEPTESGMYFKEIQAGDGDKPGAGDRVKVHYTLYRLSDKKLQSSKDMGKPFTFTLGRGEVIPGWDEAVPMMNEGGTYKVLIPSRLAYKDRGAGADIPPYTPLLFEIELLEINPEE
ncbi:MAG: FKBP-type peptidyl-prolyl cis-trans isomerase [Bacteroidales bacterium]|nr:FKBP-type peptidyl-prolyl cis-trans isomerase [Bacteroidales bacterium]MCF8399020.1 FKBP-type peptidyl-prolyl cis-trans isomerase [Bacteroidales bacterium]